MIKITLNEALEKKGRSVYWLTQNSGVPHVTLWKLSKAETQNSINLPVLSRICAALQCEPGDLLKFVSDAEAEAIAAVVKVRSGEPEAGAKTAAKKATKKGAK
ncbi:MAG: helix-turn-helix domain-containing protein [Blastocatellia bacterium]